jgi:hypothetical protein
MTDTFRALCAELVDSVELLLEMRAVDAKPMAITEDRLCRALAALAQPEPEGATDEELKEWYHQWSKSNSWWGYGDRPVYFARAVLERWGRPAIEPENQL